MLRLGTGSTETDESEFEHDLTLRMIEILQEHGWSFTYSRDPVLILIEVEEYLSNEENDES